MILDTCALLFLANGDRRLSGATRDRLESEPVRWFSAISTFEIASKHRQDKLELPRPPLTWMRELSHRYELTEVPLESTICAQAAALPLHHRDPFDRFIIASALRLNVPVVTIDPKFTPYGVVVVS